MTKPAKPSGRAAACALWLALAACGGGGDVARGADAGDAVPAAPAPRPDTSPRAGAQPDTPPPSGAPTGVGADTSESAAAGDWREPPLAADAPQPGGAPTAGVGTLRSVRTARHEGFDRVVFDFGGGPLPGYRIEYQDQPVRCGSGAPAGVDAPALLAIQMEPARAHDDDGRATAGERTRAPGLPAVRALSLTCDFEAHVDWVAGLAGRVPVRVLTLRDPARLVVDARHAR